MSNSYFNDTYFLVENNLISKLKLCQIFDKKSIIALSCKSNNNLRYQVTENYIYIRTLCTWHKVKIGTAVGS